MYDIKYLTNGLKELGIDVSDEKEERLILFYELLVEKNKVMNLTAITDFREVVRKHFLDSLAIATVGEDLRHVGIDLNKALNVMDVGTGAGFPGVPIKIIYDNINITLLDSLNKRIEFLKEAILRLEVPGVYFVHGRAEDVAKDTEHREKYDIVLSRAVAKLSILCEYNLPFVSQGGVFVAYKGPDVEDEIIHAKRALNTLGGEIVSKKSFYLPESDEKRTLLIIKKVTSTPSRYPRRAGVPEKKPLE